MSSFERSVLAVAMCMLSGGEAISGAGAQPPMVGGPCSYVSYPGTCSIVTVDETEETRNQTAHAPYAGRRVTFTFTPRGVVPQTVPVASAIARTHELRLANSWYPGPRFLEKYAIRTGAEMACRLDIIRRGSCTPVIIEFDAIDRTDYFENGK